MTDLTRFVTRHGRRIEVETLPSKSAPRRPRVTFAKVPLKEAAAAAKATRSQQMFVWIWLQYRAWWLKRRTFPVSNMALAEYGIGQDAKLRALRALEAARLIEVEWRGTKTPMVTLI